MIATSSKENQMSSASIYDMYILFSTPASQERLNKLKPLFTKEIHDFDIPGDLEYNFEITTDDLNGLHIQEVLDSIHFANDTTVAAVAIDVSNRYGNLNMYRSKQSDMAKAVGYARRTVYDIKDNLDQFSETLDNLLEFGDEA